MKFKKLFTVLIFFLSFSVTALGLKTLAHDGDTYLGSWADPSNLKLQIFSSAMDYESYFLMHAGFAWNGISSKVKITKMSSRSDDEDLGYQLRVYGSNLGKEGYWADALNFKKTWYGGYSSCWDCDYARSRIRINHDRFPNISSEFTKKKVATHEIGHSIGLRHPAKRHNGVEPTAIMNQGTLTYNVPQSHDQVLIINKYGE